MTTTVPEAPRPGVDRLEPPRIAVIGAGVAGSACAAGLLRAGFDVTAFDKSRGVGGRMATRRAQWIDADGVAHGVAFDHGCPHFLANRPRFRTVVDRVAALGGAVRWEQHVHAAFPAAKLREVVVPTPDMPAFCRHLLNGVPLRLGAAVSGLQRATDGWMLQLDDERVDGPFEQIVLAMPAKQAAHLLLGQRDDWAEALAEVRMSPCWTLMAVTDDLDWPWDAAEVERGELAWIARHDRVPGRAFGGTVPWVAHATPEWSLAHLEDDPVQVAEALCEALGRLLTGSPRPRWHHRAVHRWRYAGRLPATTLGAVGHWWSTALGLGVCGDAFGDGSVEAAWHSGDGLAAALMASVDAAPSAALATTTGSDAPWPVLRHRRATPFHTLADTATGDTRGAPLDAHS